MPDSRSMLVRAPSIISNAQTTLAYAHVRITRDSPLGVRHTVTTEVAHPSRTRSCTTASTPTEGYVLMSAATGDTLPGPAGWRNGRNATAAQVLHTATLCQGSSAKRAC